MQQINSKDGTTIGFWQSGAGLPLLFVHGMTADHRRWAAIAPHFEEHFTVYVMDRRGRGGSSDSPTYDLMREAEDVAAVVEAIGEPVFLLGHSYGATCSLEAALLTAKIGRLILYEPAIPTGLPFYPAAVPDQMYALIQRNEWEAALELFMREVVRMPDHELDVYRRLAMWQLRIPLVPTILRELAFDRTYWFNAEKFASLQPPTLLLLGGDSPPLFQQAIALIDSVLPDSRVVTLAGQRHIAMDTNPALFVREVRTFLGKS